MTESDTNREIIHSICDIPRSWAWKIPDTSPMNRMTQRYVPARAFDISACIHGQFYAIEGKLVKSLGGLSANGITEFEKRSLAAVERAGGAALLAIAYHVQKATPQQMRKHELSSPKVRQLFLLPWTKWAELEAALPEGAGTVARPDIVAAGVSVEWLGKGRWDIERALFELHSRSDASVWPVGSRDDNWAPFDASRFGKETGEGDHEG